MSTPSGVLEAIDRILNRGGADVAQQVVEELHRLYPYAAIAFVASGGQGPEAGDPTAETDAFPISFEGKQVAELRIGGAAPDRQLLERIATIVSPYVSSA
jgi:hypothetical protein